MCTYSAAAADVVMMEESPSFVVLHFAFRTIIIAN
jgi:hypothetical protein